MKDILATLEAVKKTANEVSELLSKSLPPPPPAMQKAEDEDADDVGGDMDPTTPPPATEGENPAMESPEGGEGEGETVDEFAQEIASMSDDELDMLLQALATEMEKRQGAMASPEQQPEAQQPPPPSPEMEAMKAENISMKKSIQVLSEQIETMKKTMTRPVGRPANMNKNPQVLAKSTKEPEMLSKSEILSHLENLRKSGNRAVDVDLMWTANYAKSDDELKGVYQAAKIKGITIPMK